MKSLIYLSIGFLPIVLFVVYIVFDIIKETINLYGWKKVIKYSSIVAIVLG